MKKLMLLISTLIIFSETIHAQYTSCSRWYLDANYIFFKPLEDFSA